MVLKSLNIVQTVFLSHIEMKMRKIINVIFIFIAKVEYLAFSKLFTAQEIVLVYSNHSDKFNNLTALAQALRRKQIRFVEISAELSIKNVFLLSRSSIVIVDQTTPLLSNIALNKKTKLIQVWHAGGAFKKVGFDASNGTIRDLKRIKRIHGNTSYIVISDKSLTSTYSSAFRIPFECVLPFGLLRSDLYKGKTKTVDSGKIVLWAPTFRTDKNRKRYCPITPEEVNFLQAKLLEKGLVLAIRLHPSLEWNSSFNALNWGNKSLIECIQESGTIITDYSSIIFDFSLLGGRIFWHIKDKLEYAQERGLYFDPEKMFPDFVSHTLEDLILNILLIKHENAQELKDVFMSACDGHACDRMIEFIYFLENRRSR